MKHLKYLILIIAGLYLVTFGFVIIDVSDSRPLVSLFKKFQSDSALKVVDFSIDEEAITKTKPTPNMIRTVLVTIMFSEISAEKSEAIRRYAHI